MSHDHILIKGARQNNLKGSDLELPLNEPIGACEICRGFGHIIGIGCGLVIADQSKTLRNGAIKPWQAQS